MEIDFECKSVADLTGPVDGVSLVSDGGGDHTLTFEPITPGTCQTYWITVVDLEPGARGITAAQMETHST